MNDAEFKEISEFVYLLADNSKKITLEGFYSNLDPKTKKFLKNVLLAMDLMQVVPIRLGLIYIIL